MDTKSARLGKALAAYRGSSASKHMASKLAAARKRSADASDGNVQKQDDPIGTGKVTCSSLNVRSGAGTNFDRIGGLTNGKSFEVYEEKDGWLKIPYGTSYGWISKKYTDYKTPEPPKPTFTPYQVSVTATDGLRVRNVPGNGGTPADGSTIYGTLSYGTVVTVLEEKNGWFRIEYNGKEGWICGLYVEKYNPGSTTEVSTNGVPLFAQGDSRWGGDYMGKSGKTIKQIGCAMTSTTMALNKTSGKSFTPKDMNKYLNNNGGYTSGGAIYWGTAAKYVNKSYTAKSYTKGNVDGELNAGRPVVISVKSEGHWVCVAGRKSDGTYIIHDPAGGKVLSGSWSSSYIKVSGYTKGTCLRTFG
ncbi:MAG: SH3 domain-containing protein [Proteobacteria bacterium]|nr:SH3 domain-containing protein [Pseudomonadota bacterium]